MQPRVLVLSAAALIAAPARLPAQIFADTAAMIDQVFAPFDRSDSPGCVVGVDRGGTAIFRRGYGMASLEFGIPLSEHSMLESGSLAKQFTAGAIMYLALQGKLDIDDPIRKYVPELHDFGTPITIRMALNHTSGLRDYWGLFLLSGINIGEHLFSMGEAYTMVYRQRELNFPPGSAYLYSGTGYLLLTKIVERVSGMPLAQYSQETFFEPLGMVHTQWRDDWNRVVPGRATAYARADGESIRVSMPFMHVYGSGSLLTTVGDLLRWNEHLTHPTVHGQGWADLMHRRGRLTDGTEIRYAAGLNVTEYRGELEISHDGGSAGYRTYLARWPARHLSVALMCNLRSDTPSSNPTELGRRVADVFMGLEGPRSQPSADQAPDTTGSGQIPAAELAGLVGAYFSPELNAFHRLTATEGRLMLQIGERDPRVLRRVMRDEYVTGGIRLKFTRAPDGTAKELRVSIERARNIRFVRQ